MPTNTASAVRPNWKAFQLAAPETAAALSSISESLSKSGIEHDLLEIIKVRVSQINGCAFCIQYQTNDAHKVGVAQPKLDLLVAWRDAGIFSDREKAALAWAEAVTLQAQHHIGDATFAEVAAQFSEPEVIILTVAIGLINFWNRIAAPFQFAPPIPAPKHSTGTTS